MKTVCLYAYYEKDSTYRENLAYFLKHGLNDLSDFVLIINGKCSLPLPERRNLLILYRENVGYDFGAWSYGLKHIDCNDYQYFIFVNTSVRGPYPYLGSKDAWQLHFLRMIRGNVKLVGTTICICTMHLPMVEAMGYTKPYNHVQSQVFAMDRECLGYLKERIFQADVEDIPKFMDLVQLKELGMSQLVLKRGWNIDCLLPMYRGLDYLNTKEDINPTSDAGNSYLRGAYFGGTIQPEEVVFIKTNRGLLNVSSKTKIIAIALVLLVILNLVYLAKKRSAQ